jgi:hypothetical protein
MAVRSVSSQVHAGRALRSIAPYKASFPSRVSGASCRFRRGLRPMAETAQRFRSHLDRIARAGRRHVGRAGDDAGIEEILVQMNCLKRMRFWHISPVATLTGETASRILRCPSISSGLVGSSTNQGSAKARSRIQSIASSTSQTWLASTICLSSGPTVRRAIVSRRLSSVRSRPTYIWMCRNSACTASRQRRASFSPQ